MDPRPQFNNPDTTKRDQPWKGWLPFLFFLPLAVLAILFALNAQENRNSAKEWQEVATTRKAEARDLAAKLLASEKDVRLLEKRQSQLSEEKASVEDEKTLVVRLSSELVKAGTLQQNCSNRLALLAERIADRDWDWVEKNTGPIFLACDNANLRFQGIAKTLERNK